MSERFKAAALGSHDEKETRRTGPLTGVQDTVDLTAFTNASIHGIERSPKPNESSESDSEPRTVVRNQLPKQGTGLLSQAPLLVRWLLIVA
jgi:hypothetical protein